MAKRCQITGKTVMSGNNVSHANNKTRRRFLPNLQETSLMSDTLGRPVRVRLTASAIRTVEHKRGLDDYLLSAKESVLSPEMAKLRRQIKKARAAA